MILSRAGQARRRADGGVALRAAARRGRRRGALERRATSAATRYLDWARALDRPIEVQPPQAAGAEAAARRAAAALVGDRDRALAARSLHDLRQAHSQAARRSTRSTWRRARPTAATSSTARSATSPDVRGRLAGRSRSRAAHASAQALRAARRLSGGARVLVAALPAHRPLVRRLRGRAPRQRRGGDRRDRRRDRDSDRRARFTLRTRADRIERLADGRYAILDYKTGQVPTDKQVRIGLSPQLTLEAAILRGGGFGGIPAGGSVADLAYVALRGGEPAGEEMHRSISRTATPNAMPTARSASSARLSPASTTSSSPTARWCCRCGRTATATTTISPASRNGRSAATMRTSREAGNEGAPRNAQAAQMVCSLPHGTRACPGSA